MVDVARGERHFIGLVKKIGVKYHGSVGAIWYSDYFGPALPQKIANSGFISVIALEIPVERGSLVPNQQASSFAVFIRTIRCNPKIDVHSSKIGVHFCAASAMRVFECPGIQKRMVSEYCRKIYRKVSRHL